MINLGELFKSTIDRNNMTQKDAAEVFNITPQALNGYIRNKRNPDIMFLKSFLQYFELDANIILEIKLERPREYVTLREQNLLRTYREAGQERKNEIDVLLYIFNLQNYL